MRTVMPWRTKGSFGRGGLFLISTLSLYVFSPALHSQDNNGARSARLGMIQGDVQIRLPGEQALTKAVAGSPLPQGVAMVTGIGSAEILLEGGATGYLGDNSSLRVTELSSSPAGRVTRMALDQGIARFYVNTRGTGAFIVAASGVTVAPQELADFRVEAGRFGTVVRALEGSVLITGTNMNWTLRKDETWSLAPGAAEGRIIEGLPSNGLGYWLPLWRTMPPPNANWLKTPPYSVPFGPTQPVPYVPYYLQFPHLPAARPLPRFPEQPPLFPERAPRFPQ